jgi:hypothetical protein
VAADPIESPAKSQSGNNSRNNFPDPQDLIDEIFIGAQRLQPRVVEGSPRGLTDIARQGQSAMASPALARIHGAYYSSWPSSLPVFRLTKCNLAHAGQAIPSYSLSGAS